MMTLVALAILTSTAEAGANQAPYPPSSVIQSITWNWDTYTSAAPGSDLWPVTWGPDDHLYTAWGDGGGFGGTDTDGRVNMVRDRSAYQFFHGLDRFGQPTWASDGSTASPIFTDANGVTPGAVVYNPAVKRFLLSSFHVGPGQLGVFDASDPWGPWTTVAYYEHWGQMSDTGEGLSCEFPQKWISADGLTLWSVFSVDGEGGKQGLRAHDKFNLVKVTLRWNH